MQKGNPAAAMAIITSIFGVAGIICLLPDAHVRELVTAQVIPSRAPLVLVAAPTTVTATRPFVGKALAQKAVPAATPAMVVHPDSPSVSIPLQFSDDPGRPPELPATQLAFLAASAAPVTAESSESQDRRMGPVPAAFDRTGSALALAFRKTGAGVKTAFAVLTP